MVLVLLQLERSCLHRLQTHMTLVSKGCEVLVWGKARSTWGVSFGAN